MADGLDEQDGEVEPGLEAANPSAVAMALGRAGRSGSGKAVDAEAAAFLHEQRQLAADQRRHLEVQLKHLGLKDFAERLRVGLQLFVALGATALVLFVVGLVWQAATDNGLVIQAFSVPPDLAARGLTGQVIASQIEDKLSALQAATDSGRAETSYSNDWGHEIKVEIPETGVSISELQRYLRQWLGHETRIDGEVFHAGDGLRLTVRIGGQAGDTASGPEADLDRVLEQGAEALFARTQPYRYGVFLMQRNRLSEARAAFARLVASGTAAERPWGLLGVADLEDDPHRQVATFHRSLALNPNIALTTTNLSSAEQVLGHAELGYAGLVDTVRLLQRKDRGSMSAKAAPSALGLDKAFTAEVLGDYRGSVAAFLQVMRLPVSYYGSRERAAAGIAQDLALDHDIAGARSATPLTHNDAEVARSLARWGGGGITPWAAIHQGLDDWAGVLTELEGLAPELVVIDASAVGQGSGYENRTGLWPVRAIALAHLGRIPEAQALAAATPDDCYLCVDARGQVAALAGRQAEADRWFAEAVRQGPSLPQAHFDWANAKLARGDVDGAIAELTIAHQKGPRFADPLELWGEALIRKGDLAGAVAKFEEADGYAPRWGRNHLRWGQALARLGKASEAQAQFGAAAGLELSAADRAELAKVIPHG